MDPLSVIANQTHHITFRLIRAQWHFRGVLVSGAMVVKGLKLCRLRVVKNVRLHSTLVKSLILKLIFFHVAFPSLLFFAQVDLVAVLQELCRGCFKSEYD